MALWEDVVCFPQLGAGGKSGLGRAGRSGSGDDEGADSDSLARLVARLDALGPSTVGAMFMPTDPSNPCADVYGLFRAQDQEDDERSKFVLMAVQCKDWFQAPRSVPPTCSWT